MSNQTYAELQKQLATIQSQLRKVRTKEVKGVVKRMREAIDFYGITPQELGFVGYRDKAHEPAGRNGKAIELREAKRPGPKTSEEIVPGALYRSPSGKEWDGRGQRPPWLTWQCSHNGAKPSDFLVSSEAPAGTPTSRRGKVRKVRPTRPPKYHDGQGNTWNGQGRKPFWFRDALAAGKTPESMLIEQQRQAA